MRPDQLEELRVRAAVGMDFGLVRMRSALAALGRPEERFRAVHVAGTNGKGSVTAMVESIARASGLSTGMTTSPHLCRYAERVCLGGEPLDDDAFADVLARVMHPSVPRLTFFETLIAAAFVAFADARVNLAVVEVGLGGRLDATNVLPAPLVTAITSIGFDHTALLGDTLAAIAREKAGIVKARAPVVLGPVAPEAAAAIDAVAREVGAGFTWRVRSVGADVLVAGPAGDLGVAPEIALFGPHQRRNAAVALGIAHALEPTFPGLVAHVPEGLAKVRWPGRFERIARDGRTIVLDCAHNPEGVAALVEALVASNVDPARTTLVFGALADKAWPAMLAALAPLAERRVYTTPAGRAAAALDDLAAIAPGERVADVPAAVERAVSTAGSGDVVVVAGSAYLVGEVRALLFGLQRDPPVAL